MKTSSWMRLAAGCLGVLGLFVWWPFFIVGFFLAFGAWKQRETEKKNAVAARYAHTRR